MAGLFGDLMMLILFTVQHLAFGYHSGTLESGAEYASDPRPLAVLLTTTWCGATGPAMACGGGVELAAVYNVPLGDALFTAEVMMGSISLPVVLPALACSGIATVTAWLDLPGRATYMDVPGYHATLRRLAWALLAGPLIGVITLTPATIPGS